MAKSSETRQVKKEGIFYQLVYGSSKLTYRKFMLVFFFVKAILDSNFELFNHLVLILNITNDFSCTLFCKSQSKAMETVPEGIEALSGGMKTCARHKICQNTSFL